MIPLKDNIPTDRFPLVTVALILANIAVYILLTRHGGSLTSGPDTHEVVKYGAIPFAITHPGWHCGVTPDGTALRCLHAGLPGALPTWQTVFTAMFMHASILHIAGNMLFLWIFGNNVEDAMGHVRFLVFYLLAGLAAMALQVAVDPSSTAPAIGASGAIAGVLGAYMLLYPRARVITLVFIIFFVTILEVPAVVLLGFWFLLQVLYGQAQLSDPTGGGGVAYFAHIGGFVAGMALIVLMGGRRPRRAVSSLYPPDRWY